ncbi:MAG: hypothetical protein ACE5JG_09990, partial [Planctomycetota bacterium]
MRRTLWRLLLAAHLAGVTGVSPRAAMAQAGDAASGDPERFLRVRSWVGTLNVVREEWLVGSGYERRTKSARIRVTVPDSIRTNEGWSWSNGETGDPIGTASVTASDVRVYSGPWDKFRWVGSGSGTSPVRYFELHIHSKGSNYDLPAGYGEYSISAAPSVTVHTTWTRKNYRHDPAIRRHRWFTTGDSHETDTKVGAHVWQEPLPARGLTLRGSRTIHKSSLMGGRRYKTVTTVGWKFVPEGVFEPEVVVQIPQYDRWVPRATSSEQAAGSGLQVIARLRGRDGEEAEVRARRFVFELVDVSREPGVCMNFPDPLGREPHPDLQFDVEANMEADTDVEVVGKDGQQAETEEGAYTEAVAIVSAFDWGAYGLLKVTAELEDGRKVVGQLETDPSRLLIPLPKRRDGSRIADAWKELLG